MDQGAERGAFYQILASGYNKIFGENWPIWVGGLLIGITSVITFAWARPWGVAGGLRNWGDWIFYLLGVYSKKPLSPFISTNSILTLGLLWGAFGSALMSRQFSIRMAPAFELLKGMVGGILMGIGAAMAGGCNVGGFFSATSAMSLGGVMMMLGLVAGAYLGIRYLFWELEHIPSAGGGGISGEKKKGFDWGKIQPYVGAAVILGAVVFGWIYSTMALTRVGVLLLCGVAFGLIIQRTRFCFVRCFRDPFMTGEAEMARAVATSLMISILGFAALKWTGLRPEEAYVTQAFWFGGVVGGLIFGFGMVVAGGCGSGSVWRAGEGHVKLIIAVLFFSLSTSLFKAWIRASKTLSTLMGRRVFLPDLIGYKWTVIGLIALMGAYFLVTTWNEETDKFTIEI